MKTSFRVLTFCVLTVLSLAACNTVQPTETPAATATPVAAFDGNRAYQDVVNQVNFGPRVPGSASHEMEVDYITSELKAAGWQVEIQSTIVQGHEVVNITGYREKVDAPIILCAHYDSRMIADQDPDPSLRDQPVPAANDGASGVAVLLEIARVLPADRNDVWLVFFDAEDQGDIEGWDWILGSSIYADALQVTPQSLVLLDMIGDADLNIHREISSDAALTDEIFQTAADLGYSKQFINTAKYNMIDDHTPFLKKGIPAVDLIDFDYSYWHTTTDTANKVSAQSLQIVGDVLLAWLAH